MVAADGRPYSSVIPKGAGTPSALNCLSISRARSRSSAVFPTGDRGHFGQTCPDANRRSCRHHRRMSFASSDAKLSVQASWCVQAAARQTSVALRSGDVNEAACLACMVTSAAALTTTAFLACILVKIVSTVQLFDSKYLCMRHEDRKNSGPKVQENPWNVRVQVGQRRLGIGDTRVQDTCSRRTFPGR